ncbi:MAG: hypothetical protein CM1200mP2_19370 [Planctomycetaceae bacterium]|nr:MAG: hypothetical protein CM1200mP2_19370 [Planctomycetaceae bacterium]
MQTAAPDLIDLSDETKQTLRVTVCSEKGCRETSRETVCSLAEWSNGVRFINIFHGGWDAHLGFGKGNVASNCNVVDQPVGALLADLKQRGMLDSTWSFGARSWRTPLVQGKDGRDHHPHASHLDGRGGRVGDIPTAGPMTWDGRYRRIPFTSTISRRR